MAPPPPPRTFPFIRRRGLVLRRLVLHRLPCRRGVVPRHLHRGLVLRRLVLRYWVLDRVIHTLYIVVCFLAKSNVESGKWKKYLTDKTARHDFQIDLGLELLSYGIAQDWYGKSKRPDYMRKREFVPCGCEKWYFCIT